MKALEILKKIYANNPDTRFQRNNIDINFTIHDFSNVNEAIKELEALEKRSCEGCSADYIKCKIFIAYWKKTESSCIDDSKCFYCNKWEPK